MYIFIEIKNLIILFPGLTLLMSFDSLIIVQKQKTPSQSHLPFQWHNQVSVCPEMGSVANPVLPELPKKK